MADISAEIISIILDPNLSDIGNKNRADIANPAKVAENIVPASVLFNAHSSCILGSVAT